MGKSQLALEFAYRHRDVFQYVFWLPAEHETALAERFAEIIRLVGKIEADNQMGIARRTQLSKEWLETTSKSDKKMKEKPILTNISTRLASYI